MGYRNIIDSASKRVLAELQKNDGFIPYTDKSKPDDVRNVFNLSKKAFKKALGNLYKNKIVTLDKDGTRLVK
jgi:predicted RNA-binding protein (virulence factor B family)